METTLAESVERWIEHRMTAADEELARSAGPSAWARARIDRVLAPGPLPGSGWVHVPTLAQLAPFATPAERLALLRRASTPRHDDAASLLGPLDAAFIATFEAHPPSLTGVNLDDTPAVIAGLSAIVARGRAGLAHDLRAERYVARDFSLYDRFDFELTRAALRALPLARRDALIRAALSRHEPLALQVIDTVPIDESLFEAAWAVAATSEPSPEHRPTAARGLARGGSAVAPWLLAKLTQAGVTRGEVSLGIDALAWLRAPQGADALVGLTGHGSTAVSAQATRALAGLGPAARAAIDRGLGSRKKTVRASCEWLLAALDAAPMCAVRDAHAAMTDAARERVAQALAGSWVELGDALRELGPAGVVEAIDRWCERTPNEALLKHIAKQPVPDLAWALAWVLVTRPMHRRHLGCVGEALSRVDGREAALALLQARPESIREIGLPMVFRSAQG